ncbi:TPA: nitrate ABC transporter substrate-binding protein [Candidatus Falkowbacteria bacterium]|nr:nitrate ABC transporter substrate-binding protein [Candidatus Falkowbacteria bacterium]
MRRWCLWAILAVTLVSNQVSAQQLKPIWQDVHVSVGEVTPSDCVQLPVITWGGEYETVFANGNEKRTKSGSLFAQAGLCFDITLQDDFRQQFKDYMSGKTPYLRGTLDMINAVTEATKSDPRVQPVVVLLLTRSTGGDAVVVTEGIKTAADFKGKRVALQAYGPHMYYLWRILKSVNLSVSDVKLVWTDDLTASDKTAAEALRRGQADVAFAIIPDALALSSNGTVGTGAEGSVKGARILLSTKSADHVIFDVFAVRSDYFNAHKETVYAFAQTMLRAGQDMAAVVKAGKQEYRDLVKAFAKIILGSDKAVEDAGAMYADCTFSDIGENQRFFSGAGARRSFREVVADIQSAFRDLGLMAATVALTHAEWDYSLMGSGAKLQILAEKPLFDEERVAAVVDTRLRTGTLDSDQILPTSSIFFEPNQIDFSAARYQDEYDQIIAQAAVLGGAVIVIEGNADPMGYLRKKKAGDPQVILTQVRQVAKSLTVQRSMTVRDSIIQYAASKGVTLDPTQFTVVGHGFEQPRSGMCGADPCAPKTEQQWRENMRVDFRLISMEAEASAFKPL